MRKPNTINKKTEINDAEESGNSHAERFGNKRKFTVRITMTRKEGGKEKKACRSYSELLVLPRADCFGGTGGALLSEPKLLLEITESLEEKNDQVCSIDGYR